MPKRARMDLRAQVAEALYSFVTGEIKSDAFDEIIFKALEGTAKENDEGLYEAVHTLWTFYDDFKDEPLGHMNREGRSCLFRIYCFLMTNQEPVALPGWVRKTFTKSGKQEWNSIVSEHYPFTSKENAVEASELGAVLHPWLNAERPG